MHIPRTVALVGRPNVGKSRLFNRLVGRRVSIVHDQPGVTRDLVTAHVPAASGGFILMDTGGLGLAEGMAPAVIARATEEQVDFAIQAAGLVLLVTDARTGVTLADERIAERLRAYHKPTMIVVNKADDDKLAASSIADFYGLGFGDPVAVSAEHGRGLEALGERILKVVGAAPEGEEHVGDAPEVEETDPMKHRVKFALVGRPNVGKSSLGNALLKSPRLIVSEVPGTTRDAIAIEFEYAAPGAPPLPFTLLDTAGLRHARSVRTSVEFFSQNRTRQAIEESDVVFLVIDALSGITKQDKTLAGEIVENGASLVLIVNKWDLAREKFQGDGLPGYKNLAAFQKSFLEAIQRELFFLPHAPVLFASALEEPPVAEILELARTMFATQMRKLPTGTLNRFLRERLEAFPPKFVQGRRFKCYYALQVARRPFVVRMYCNHEGKLDANYSRHLEAALSEAFRLRGCPIRFDLIGKPPRETSQGTKKPTKHSNWGTKVKLPPTAD